MTSLILAFIQSGGSGIGFLEGIGSVLITVAPFVGLACLVAAGVALRGEGGTNFSLGGGFTKWMLWAFIFCALPTVPLIISSLTNNSVNGLSASFSGGGSEFTGLAGGIQNFVQNWLVARAVPAIAGFLVVKAILDSCEGQSPLSSLIAAIFLLSVTGIWTLAKGWVGSDQYGIAAGMTGALGYILAAVCPICGAFCFIGAIVQWLKGQGWGRLVISGIAMLSATGIWTLVQSWG